MIAFVSHPYHRGGVTKWIADSLNYLNSVNVSCCLVTISPLSRQMSAGNCVELKSLLNTTVKVVSQRVSWKFEFGTIAYKAHVLNGLIAKLSPGYTLIPSDDEVSWLACSWASSFHKFIGVLHSDEIYYYDLYKRYHPYTTGIVCVSNRIKSNLAGNTKIIIIPCGSSLNSFTSTLPRNNDIVFVGRLEEKQKRISDLLPIFRKVIDEFPKARLIVWGDGPDFDILKRDVIENCLQNSVILKGWGSTQEILDSLQSSKVLIQTSNYEGMSIAAMEALGSGCAIISSAVSGIEDYVNQSTVKLFKIGDKDNASKLILESIQEFDLNTSMNAVKLFKKHFSIEVCTTKYIEYIETLPLIRGVKKKPGWLPIYGSLIISILRILKHRFQQYVWN